MTYIAIGLIGTTIWMAFEMWRAPMLKEEDNGTWKTVKPTKSLKDFFKRK